MPQAVPQPRGQLGMQCYGVVLDIRLCVRLLLAFPECLLRVPSYAGHCHLPSEHALSAAMGEAALSAWAV